MLLTVVSLSVSDPNFNCTQYGENQTLCCKQPSCAFVNCTVNNKTVTHEGQGWVEGHKMTYKICVHFGRPMCASHEFYLNRAFSKDSNEILFYIYIPHILGM